MDRNGFDITKKEAIQYLIEILKEKKELLEK